MRIHQAIPKRTCLLLNGHVDLTLFSNNHAKIEPSHDLAGLTPGDVDSDSYWMDAHFNFNEEKKRWEIDSKNTHIVHKRMWQTKVPADHSAILVKAAENMVNETITSLIRFEAHKIYLNNAILDTENDLETADKALKAAQSNYAELHKELLEYRQEELGYINPTMVCWENKSYQSPV